MRVRLREKDATHRWRITIDLISGKTIVGEIIDSPDEDKTVISISGCYFYGVELADGLEWINVNNIEKFRLESLGNEDDDDDGVMQKLFGVERL